MRIVLLLICVLFLMVSNIFYVINDSWSHLPGRTNYNNRNNNKSNVMGKYV